MHARATATQIQYLVKLRCFGLRQIGIWYIHQKCSGMTKMGLSTLSYSAS